jgi:hypothetical protein
VYAGAQGERRPCVPQIVHPYPRRAGRLHGLLKEHAHTVRVPRPAVFAGEHVPVADPCGRPLCGVVELLLTLPLQDRRGVRVQRHCARLVRLQGGFQHAIADYLPLPLRREASMLEVDV